MSSIDLEIGKLSEFDEEHVLEELGYDVESADAHPAWSRYERPTVRIALLNLASLVCFTDYVARLDKFKDPARALGRAHSKNLPVWETSIWLPERLEKRPQDADSDCPIFIGSSLDLLADLTEIQGRSELALGTVPKAYHDMRADFDAFAGLLSFNLEDERDTIRWVWQGLRDGAELAIKSGAPMCCYAA